MNYANMFAYLVGVISAESQRRAQTHNSVNHLARDIWHTAAGEVWSSEPEANMPLPYLDPTGAERLYGLVSERVSTTAAEMIDWYRRHRLLNSVNAYSQDHSGYVVQFVQADLYRELLAQTEARLLTLNDKPEETAHSALHALWHSAAGNPMSAERAHDVPLPELDSEGVATLHELLTQRYTGIPLAHLTGRQRFMGLELNVGKAALVPRKETELVGYAALAVLRRLASEQNTLRVIDVCTGAGNLAFALAAHEPKAWVYASDLSTEAIELARCNCAKLGLDGQVEFRQGDFLTPFAGGDFEKSMDMLVCNPPYISSGKVGKLPAEIIGHEPLLAFDGGPLGIKILQRLVSEAPRFLRSGGWLAFEVGLGQGPAIIERLRRSKSYADISAVRDGDGAIRAIVARV